MKLSYRLAAGTAVLATTAGMLLLGAGSASAAGTTPPWEPDPNGVGTLSFYDAQGNQIFSGHTDTAPFAAYVKNGSVVRAGDVSAGLFFANPDPNKSPALWYLEQVGLFTSYPISSGPAGIANQGSTPINTGGNTDQTLDGFRSDLAGPSTAPGYDHVVQVRMRTANSAGAQTAQYGVADVLVNDTTHTWKEVYPSSAADPTSTSVASNNNPSFQGDAVTFTATVNDTFTGGTVGAVGTVQFKDGGTNIGTAQAVDGTGKATLTTSALSVGDHPITAVFTPTDATAYSSSTGGPITQTVKTPPTATATTLAVTQDGYAGDEVDLTANVTGPGSTPNNAGTVSFYDNGSSTPLNSNPVSGTNGAYTLALPSGLAKGNHSIVAKFTPTDAAAFKPSSSAAQSFTLVDKPVGACAQAGSQCTDAQNVQVTVPVGTLVISTPYTATSPLDLGSMQLSSDGKMFTASGAFQHIDVTDTRSGINGANQYTVSAISSDLTSTTNANSHINAQNVGLTNVVVTPGAGFNGSTTPHDNFAASPPVAAGVSGNQGLGGTAKAVFDATNSNGSVDANGTLTINAPTSTENGLYKGIITFTVG